MLEQAQAHVIVTDLSMPGIDGVEFVTLLRGHRGEADSPTPVIAVTAFPENYVREAMHELGFRSYLVKPVNPERIAREVLAVHNYVQEARTGDKLEVESCYRVAIPFDGSSEAPSRGLKTLGE
jgi:CheY-like chemotaxis protein